MSRLRLCSAREPGIRKLGIGRSFTPAGVCERNYPPDERTRRNISTQNTKSGAGEQFLLLGRDAKVRVKGVFCSQTYVYYYCYYYYYNYYNCYY